MLSVFFKHWKTIHFKPERAFIVSIVLSAFFLLLNSNILVLFGYEEWNNGTRLLFCFQVDGFPFTYWMNTYGQIHSIALYSLLPFFILALANLALVIKMNSRSTVSVKNTRLPSHIPTSQAQVSLPIENKFGKMNRTVMIITLLFIVFTLPVACASFFFNTLFASEWGVFLIKFLNCVSFSYHAGTFFISYFSNAIFKNEVRRLFNKRVVSEFSIPVSSFVSRTTRFK